MHTQYDRPLSSLIASGYNEICDRADDAEQEIYVYIYMYTYVYIYMYIHTITFVLTDSNTNSFFYCAGYDEVCDRSDDAEQGGGGQTGQRNGENI